jgi:membrane protease YdiL (CAAX protease family)
MATVSTGWRGRLRRYQLVIIIVAIFVATWVVWVPRALGVPVGVLGPLWTWAPAVATVIGVGVLRGRAGLAELGRRLLTWRVGWWWYPVVLLAPLVFSLTVAGLAVLLGQPWPEVRPPFLALTLGGLLVTLLILILTDGIGEEVAWRGYLLPRLLERRGPVVASLVLGVIWWLWHLPLVWTAGAAIEGQPLWLLLVDLLAKSLIFTAVFLCTKGSLLIAILLHATTNLFAVSPTVGADGDLSIALIALVLKSLVAGVLSLTILRTHVRIEG